MHECGLPFWLKALQRLGLTAKLRLVLGRFVSENLLLRGLLQKNERKKEI